MTKHHHTIGSIYGLLASALALALAGSLGACAVPRGSCEGEFIYLDGSCRRCPDDAHFDDDAQTCICDEDAYYEYLADNTCALREGVELPEEAGDMADAGPMLSEACLGYCGFVDGCLAQNAAAASAAAGAITALGASDGDTVACEMACDSATQSAQDDPVAGCMASGRTAAACDGLDDLGGIQAALGLMDECCDGEEDHPLCLDICTALQEAPVAASMVSFCGD